MIKIENCEVSGWRAAIRGMRNPKNSWNRSDTCYNEAGWLAGGLGNNDYHLMKTLADAGQVHGKYLRMINVTVDITAPRYWWIEFDTYKVGVVKNSCSTMHKIAAKPFELDDFSYEHLGAYNLEYLKMAIQRLNDCRTAFLETQVKGDWWPMIQLLPQSYNQRATVQMNYAVLKNIFEYRKNHLLDEWITFCAWIVRLPYSELITGKKEEE